MGRHCCVKGCTTGVNLPSHIFPKDVILMNKWKEAVFGEGYSEKIQGLTDEQLRKCVVCYKHFADSDYVETYRLRRLKAGVIPSLYLPIHGNNNGEANDNGSETSNSKNSSNNAEHCIKNVTTEVVSTRIEVTTDPTVENIEGIETMREEKSVREVSQSIKNLLNGNSSVSSPSESELQFQKPRLSGLRHLESHPELVKLGTQEPILSEKKLPGVRSPKSDSSLSKNSAHSLLELHNLLQGKYFHKFTPKIWNLYKLCCILKKKQQVVAKRQLTFRERIRQAKKYSKSPAIEKLLSSLTPIQRTFLQMQMKATKYAPKDRRFTVDEKIAALSIMKQSSKCYQYLTQVFNLPSTCTLQSILQTVNVHPGPIPFVNRRLKKRVKLMKERDKVCFLTWDEMLLQPHLDYDSRKKHILGFEDFGKIRCARFADHALVFMVHGIESGWKFPLAYYFCDGDAKTDQLVEWIKTVAKIIIDSGLHLVALICNDGKRNVAAVNKLKLESTKLNEKREQVFSGNITINKQDIIPLYDPPHLIKGIRNNLLNSDLEFECAEGEERKYASWEIIEQAYHMDLTHNVYRLMPKITAEHVIKNRVKIKRVKNAAQVLSMTMGGFIHHHTKLEGYVNTINGPLKMPKKKGRDTAEIIFFFDQLFDSVNGHTLRPEKLLRVAVSYNSSHLEFWKMAIKKLQRMRFIDSKDESPLRDSTVLKNWIYTIKGFRKLWIILKKYRFKYLKPRILNQDSLRHFFGQIKSLSKRYSNPTCAEFESSFKILLINNLSSPRTVGDHRQNKMDGPLLFTLKRLIYRAQRRNDNGMTENLQISDMEIDKPLDTTHNYINICNFIAARILNDSRIKGCNICKNLLTSTVKSDLISNEHLLKMFKDADNILRQRMSNVCYMHHTALMLETELYMQEDLLWLNCQQHNSFLKELVISYIILFYIYKWCDGINDILTEHDTLS